MSSKLSRPVVDLARYSVVTANQQNKKIPFMEANGLFPVVTAKFWQLVSALTSKLSYFSRQKPEDFGKIVEWSKNILSNTTETQINKVRDDLCNLLKKLVVENTHSSIFYLLGKEKLHWYYSPQRVDEDDKENSFTLEDASCSIILEEICFRINKLINDCDKNKKCEIDTLAIDDLQKFFDYFEGLLEQIEPLLEESKNKKLPKIQEKKNVKKQSDKQGDVKNDKKQFNKQVNVKKEVHQVYRILTKNPVKTTESTSALTYASVVKNEPVNNAKNDDIEVIDEVKTIVDDAKVKTIVDDAKVKTIVDDAKVKTIVDDAKVNVEKLESSNTVV